MQAVLINLCLTSLLLGRLSAYPTSLQKVDGSDSWLNLFAPDGSIREEMLKNFPLYEYVYQDYEYGDQIWSDCGEALQFARTKPAKQVSQCAIDDCRQIFRPSADPVSVCGSQPTSEGFYLHSHCHCENQ